MELLFVGNVIFFWKINCANSETVVYMKEIECIPKCVLGFSFDFCSLVIAVVSYDVLTWIILVFEDLRETFCTFFRCGKQQQRPEVSGPCAVVQHPRNWMTYLGSQPTVAQQHLPSGPHFNLINTFTHWWSCFGTLFFRQSMYLLPNYRV